MLSPLSPRSAAAHASAHVPPYATVVSSLRMYSSTSRLYASPAGGGEGTEGQTQIDQQRGGIDGARPQSPAAGPPPPPPPLPPGPAPAVRSQGAAQAHQAEHGAHHLRCLSVSVARPTVHRRLPKVQQAGLLKYGFMLYQNDWLIVNL